MISRRWLNAALLVPLGACTQRERVEIEFPSALEAAQSIYLFLQIGDQSRLFAIDPNQKGLENLLPAEEVDELNVAVTVLGYDSKLAMPVGEVTRSQASDGLTVPNLIGPPTSIFVSRLDDERVVLEPSPTPSKLVRDFLVDTPCPNFTVSVRHQQRSIGPIQVDLAIDRGLVGGGGSSFVLSRDALEPVPALSGIRVDGGARMPNGHIWLFDGLRAAYELSEDLNPIRYDLDPVTQEAPSATFWVEPIDDRNIAVLTRYGFVSVFDTQTHTHRLLGQEPFIDVSGSGETRVWSRDLATDGEFVYTTYGNRPELFRYAVDGSTFEELTPSNEGLGAVGFVKGLGIVVSTITLGRAYAPTNGVDFAPVKPTVPTQPDGLGIQPCTLTPLQLNKADRPAFMITGYNGVSVVHVDGFGFCPVMNSGGTTTHQVTPVGNNLFSVADDEETISWFEQSP